MRQNEIVRRLAAILVGDAVGFTGLMDRDDEASIVVLARCREAVHASVDKAGGSLVDDMGDGFIAEFSSAIDAVRCALVLQGELSHIGTSRSADLEMPWKLGVNLGDVIAEGRRLYGTGLNVAVHITGLSDPGGLVVSGPVYDEVERRIEAPMTDLGPRKIRGLDRRVRTYRVRTGFEVESAQSLHSGRRLAAVLSADIFGFSRLLASDQEATLRAVRDYRSAVNLLVEAHRGTVVDFTGDNFLAEFTTALESVQCALEIQKELAVRNAERREDERVVFRIGAHLGDLRADGPHLYGNAINIASRLEGLSDPGGICISGIVREQLRGTLELDLEDLGERAVKNIPDEVRVYRVRLGG